MVLTRQRDDEDRYDVVVDGWHVDLADVEWSDVAPGGGEQARIMAVVPLGEPTPWARHYAKVEIWSKVTAERLWDGDVTDPGRLVRREGELLEIVAAGGARRLDDYAGARIYVDKDPTQRMTVHADGWSQFGDAATGDDGSAARNPAVRNAFPRGFVAGVNAKTGLSYRAAREAGQTLAWFDYAQFAGRNDTNWRVRAVTRINTASGANTRDEAMTTGGVASAPKVAPTDFTATKDVLELVIERITSSETIANDVTYAVFHTIVINGNRVTVTGAAVPSGDYGPTILPGQVVADVIGSRHADSIDGASAVIDTGTYAIDHLAYLDPAASSKILADVEDLEPSTLHYVGTRNDTGKYTFRFSAWPTAIRYIVQADDGLDLPATAADLYDSVEVRGIDGHGNRRRIVVTAANPTLDAEGVHRRGEHDMGDDYYSDANAAKLGANWLAARRDPAGAGTLTVSCPIFDAVLGRYVDPEEIQSGELVAVEGLSLAGTPGTDDELGVTVFRIVASRMLGGTRTRQMTLSTRPFLTEEQVALLSRRMRDQRRR